MGSKGASIRSILGNKEKSKFSGFTQTSRVGNYRFVTMGEDPNDYVHVLELSFNRDGYFQMQSLRNLGHKLITAEEEQ